MQSIVVPQEVCVKIISSKDLFSGGGVHGRFAYVSIESFMVFLLGMEWRFYAIETRGETTGTDESIFSKRPDIIGSDSCRLSPARFQCYAIDLELFAGFRKLTHAPCGSLGGADHSHVIRVVFSPAQSVHHGPNPQTTHLNIMKNTIADIYRPIPVFRAGPCR